MRRGLAAVARGGVCGSAGSFQWGGCFGRARVAGAGAWRGRLVRRSVLRASLACAAGLGGASGPGVARGRAVLVGAARRLRCMWVGRMDEARFSGRASSAILPD